MAGAPGVRAAARGRRFVILQAVKQGGWDDATAEDLTTEVVRRTQRHVAKRCPLVGCDHGGDARPLNLVIGDVEADMMDATAP